MSKYPIRVSASKFVETRPEPQRPGKPDWLEPGALVAPIVFLAEDLNDRSHMKLTVSVAGIGSIRTGLACLYVGEERVSKSDGRGSEIRVVVHAFLVNGRKWYAEPGWFQPFDPEKSVVNSVKAL